MRGFKQSVAGGLLIMVTMVLNAAPPPNDHFADRIVLTGSSITFTGTLAGATLEGWNEQYDALPFYHNGRPCKCLSSLFIQVRGSWLAPQRVESAKGSRRAGPSILTSVQFSTGDRGRASKLKHHDFANLYQTRAPILDNRLLITDD